MKKGEKRKTSSRKSPSPVRKKNKKPAPLLTVSGAEKSRAREDRKAEMASSSTEIDPASKTREWGGLLPALPVGEATQSPMDDKRDSSETDPGSKVSEREGLHPALPVGGATQSPLIEEAIEFLGLSLNREEYAIPVSQIKEIIRPVEMTAIPRSTAGLMGIISLRGMIIPVFNLKNKLAHIQSESREKREDPGEVLNRIIIIQIDEGILGLFVDEVTEVIRIRESDIQPSPPLFSQNGQELIRGITRIKERLVILLFIPQVIGVIKEEVEQIGRV